MNNYEKYQGSYQWKKLATDLDREAIWEIRGEDPNPDMGGSHYQPCLGVVSGKLKDIIPYAVNMPSFWAWGAGGDFREVKVTNVSNLIRKAEIQEQITSLERQITELKKLL